MERHQGGLERNFRAKWPSVTAQARHYRFVVLDVLLLAYSYFVLRSFGGSRAGSGQRERAASARVAPRPPASAVRLTLGCVGGVSPGFGRMWRNPLLLAPWGARVMHRCVFQTALAHASLQSARHARPCVHAEARARVAAGRISICYVHAPSGLSSSPRRSERSPGPAGRGILAHAILARRPGVRPTCAARLHWRDVCVPC